jgi:hypothetical protein
MQAIDARWRRDGRIAAEVACMNAPSVWQPKKVRELTPIFPSVQ